MKLVIVQSEWCDYRVISLPADHVVSVWPEDGHPHGREAREIALAWQRIRATGAAGLLLLGCDVVADPDDLAAMEAAVTGQPGDLHTGMVKLWPESTGRYDWMWSHRGGTLGSPAATQDEAVPVAYVSLGFLWAPARLLDLAAPVMPSWEWSASDVQLSELALHHGIAAHAVPGCRPKHLHFQKEHDGTAIWRRSLRGGPVRTTPGQLPHDR